MLPSNTWNGTFLAKMPSKNSKLLSFRDLGGKITGSMFSSDEKSFIVSLQTESRFIGQKNTVLLLCFRYNVVCKRLKNEMWNNAIVFQWYFFPSFLFFLLRGERIIPFENVRHTCKSPPLSSIIVDKSDIVFNESVYEQRLRAIRLFFPPFIH